jgi:hypothetical protein
MSGEAEFLSWVDQECRSGLTYFVFEGVRLRLEKFPEILINKSI